MARPSGSKEEREQVRKQAIRLLNNGMPPEKVAEIADVTRQSVHRWKRAYKENGEAGLEAKPNRGGRSTKLPKEELSQLENYLKEGPSAHGFNKDTWTYEAVSELIAEKFDLSVSSSTAGRYLKSIGWDSNSGEKSKEERDTDREVVSNKSESSMNRVTIRVPKSQITEVDSMIESGDYNSRSDAIRTAVREMLNEMDQESSSGNDRKRAWARV